MSTTFADECNEQSVLYASQHYKLNTIHSSYSQLNVYQPNLFLSSHTQWFRLCVFSRLRGLREGVGGNARR